MAVLRHQNSGDITGGLNGLGHITQIGGIDAGLEEVVATGSSRISEV